MPFSGGAFTKLYNWLTDPQRNEKIFNSRLDDEFGGIATGLSTAILKDGTSTTTARIPFAQGVSWSDGLVGTPAANFINDTDTGFYRIGANNLGMSAGGTKVFEFGTNGTTTTGNHAITGVIDVTGAATLRSTCNVLGDFSVATTKVVVTASSGNTAIAGTIDVTGAATLRSTATVLGLVDISGASAGQIKFPANQNASSDVNTLDDYEEGDWAGGTPGVTFSTPGNVSPSYSTQTGTYTKIGRLVVIQWVMVATVTHTTASGDLLITGVPIASGNVSGRIFYGGISWSGITKAGFTDIMARIQPNTTQLELIASGSGVGTSTVKATDIPSGGLVVVAGTLAYFT